MNSNECRKYNCRSDGSSAIHSKAHYLEEIGRIVNIMSTEQLEYVIDWHTSKDNRTRDTFVFAFPNNTDIWKYLDWEKTEYSSQIMEVYWTKVYEKYYIKKEELK